MYALRYERRDAYIVHLSGSYATGLSVSNTLKCRRWQEWGVAARMATASKASAPTTGAKDAGQDLAQARLPSHPVTGSKAEGRLPDMPGVKLVEVKAHGR